MEGRKYTVHILMRMWESGELDGQDSIHLLCSKFVANTEYKFCPGLDPEEYHNEYFEKIRFHIKSVRQTTTPFHRVDSVNCVMWFLLAPNATLAEKKSKEARCQACKRLITDLNCQLRRTLKESPIRKLRRQAASSRDQQEQILGELYWYTHQDSPPADVSSVSETLKYLESCSQLFEKGFLSHNKITSMESEVLENIDKGYSYFSEWLSSILKKGLYSE